MKRLLIDDLIIKPRKVDLKISPQSKEVSVWIRTARDPDKTMATAKARQESRRLRKLLNDRKSEQYDALIGEALEEAEPDDLRKMWANGRLIERAIKIRDNSLEEREYVPEPEGEGVTPKQMDEYEDKVDEAEEQREELLAKAIESAQRELDEESQKIPEKELFEAAVPSIIEIQCQNAYQAEFVAQLIMRCTFEDQKLTRPAFENVDQVYSLHPAVLEKLTNSHIGLLLDPEAVKNWQGGLNPST
jgi:phosphatidylserine/phosphatidylglycerophosphate/cardiolipin synthase-like enzyme